MPQPPLLKKPLKKKECQLPSCKQPFQPYRSWQEYCSPAHRTEHFWQTHLIVTVEEYDRLKANQIPSNVTASALTGNDNTQTPSATENK